MMRETERKTEKGEKNEGIRKRWGLKENKARKEKKKKSRLTGCLNKIKLFQTNRVGCWGKHPFVMLNTPSHWKCLGLLYSS